MTRNPEFIRNLWLVYSPGGLVFRALVIIGIYVAIYVFTAMLPSGRTEVSIYTHPAWIELSGFVFGFFVILMGKKAGHSIAEELAGHTWDAQRMSSISPWSMTWGKVFGISLNVWFAALVCILCFSYIAVSQDYPRDLLARHVAIWIIAALIAQTISLISSLLGLIAAPPPADGEGGTLGTLFMIPGIFALPVIWLNLPVGVTLNWFGSRLYAMDLLILFSVACAAWSLLGAHLLMRREFRYTNSPLPWLGFVAFVILFVFGLVPEARATETRLDWLAFKLGNVLPFLAAAALVYLAAMTDPADWRLARHLGRCIAAKDWRTLVQLMPRSVLTLIVLAILACWVLMSEAQFPMPGWAGWHGLTHDVVPAAFFIVARDAGIFLYLGFRFAGDSTKFNGFFVVGLLSVLLPFAAGMFAEPLLPFIWPVSGDGATVSLISLLIQAGAVWVLLGRRLHGIHKTVL